MPNLIRLFTLHMSQIQNRIYSHCFYPKKCMSYGKWMEAIWSHEQYFICFSFILFCFVVLCCILRLLGFVVVLSNSSVDTWIMVNCVQCKTVKLVRVDLQFIYSISTSTVNFICVVSFNSLLFVINVYWPRNTNIMLSTNIVLSTDICYKWKVNWKRLYKHNILWNLRLNV